MEIEIQQLDLRYEKLRRRGARRERQLLASISENGQLHPVVVVRADAADRFVLVDGYKRIRVLRRLASDTVIAIAWDLPAADALVLERLMRGTEPDGPIEQGWLLCALRLEFGLSLDELARRFDRSKSWVSRRLALVGLLPDIVQDRVRTGIIAPHAAMKFLVPLARANKAGCLELVAAFNHPLSIRDVEALVVAYRNADHETRARLCADPGLFLRALEAARHRDVEPLSQGALLLRDAGALGGIARRLVASLRAGAASTLIDKDKAEIAGAFHQAHFDTDRLFQLADKEFMDARPQNPSGHPQTS
jgi:ParB/RepB/Spo0J family partition protein